MFDLIFALVRNLSTALGDSRALALENLALRHRIMVEKGELKLPRLGVNGPANGYGSR